MAGRYSSLGPQPFPDSGATVKRGAMAILRFECPECGLGDYEVGDLTSEGDVYCVVCIEEARRFIRLKRWDQEETAQALLRLAAA